MIYPVTPAKLAGVCRLEVACLTDPDPARREQHNEVWRELRRLAAPQAMPRISDYTGLEAEE